MRKMAPDVDTVTKMQPNDCRECELCEITKNAMDLNKVDFGVQNPEVLIVVSRRAELNYKNEARFLLQMFQENGFDFKSNTGMMYNTRCEFPLQKGVEFEENTLKKIQRKCHKKNVKDFIEFLNPLVIIFVGEEAALGFDSTILKECRANVISSSYWSVTPNRMHYLMPSPYDLELAHNMGDKTATGRCINLVKDIFAKYCTGLQREPVTYTLLDTMEKVRQAFAIMKTKTLISSDIETTGLDAWSDKAKLLTVSFSWQSFQGVCVPMRHPESPFNEEDLAEINSLMRDIFSDPNIHMIFHNGKFDTQYIYKVEGYEVSNFTIDTMLAHYCLDPQPGRQSLKRLAMYHTDLGAYDDMLDQFFINHGINKKEEGSFAKVDLPILWKYNCCDTDATFRLWELFREDLKIKGFMGLFNHLMSVSYTFLKIERNGFLLDFELLKKVKKDFEREIDELDDKFLSMREVKLVEEKFQQAENEKSKKPKKINFNPKSTKHMGTLFWEELDLRQFINTKKLKDYLTDGGIKAQDIGNNRAEWKNPRKIPPKYLSTGAATLGIIATKTDHPVLSTLAKYRSMQKLYSSYVLPMTTKWVSNDGMVHSTNKIHGTVGGRLASEKPNMQNIPRGSVIKNLFISRFEGGYFAQLDYSQVEFRMASILCKEPFLLDAYNRGLDIHTQTASTVFGIPEAEITKQQRTYAKTINFGLIYGMTEYALSSQLGISVDEAKEFISKYFARFPMLKEWVERTKRSIINTERSESMFGRVREFPGLKILRSREDKKGIFFAKLREGLNHVVQSTAAEFTLHSVILLQRWLETNKMKTVILGTVYDSILLDIHPDEVKKVFTISRKIMENLNVVLQLDWVTIPLKADAEVGPSWGECKEALFDGAFPDLKEEGKKFFSIEEGVYYTSINRGTEVNPVLAWEKC